MIENSLNDKNSDVSDSVSLDLLTIQNTSDISTVTELWSLAKMVRDVKGDPIWDTLHKKGSNPEPFENLGYSFDYNGLTGIYFPKRNGSETIRFAIPKIIDLKEDSSNEIADKVNVANSMITESKFAVMGNEVWLLHERYMSANEDYEVVIEHILENLKSGVELFHKIC